MKQHELTNLSREFQCIIHEMDQILHKSARSECLNVAKDFSCGITLGDGGEFMIEEGDPSHLAALRLVPEAVLELVGQEEVRPGDCYITNSPLTGGTHHADFTLCVPVFYGDELLFWSINRAHQADVGAPVPTTYPSGARDIYQEGLHLPVMLIQHSYRDRKDLIRMIRLKNRVSELWYGDYLAQLGAVRAGEKRLVELCDKFGLTLVKSFIDQWLDYSERRMIQEIQRLPKRVIEYEVRHDPIRDCAPDGVPVKVRLTIDPDSALIIVDLTGNSLKNLPCGFNLSEATVLAGVYGGIFSNLPSVPPNAGSYRRVKITINEGTVVGKPRRTASTALATTNVCGRVFTAVSAAFTKLGRPYGIAEGSNGMLANWGAISGRDPRHDAEYATQIFLGAGGGPAVHGYDGWLTYGTPDSGGMMRFDSVELLEHRLPIWVKQVAIRPDSMGPGEWDGAPGVIVAYGPLGHDMSVAYYGDCHDNSPRGVMGGGNGAKADIYKVDDEGNRIALDLITDGEVIRQNEVIVSLTPGGGGYGSPLARDPKLVCKRVRDGWLSAERARETYGVVVKEEDGYYTVDWEATERLRKHLAVRRNPGDETKSSR